MSSLVVIIFLAFTSVTIGLTDKGVRQSNFVCPPADLIFPCECFPGDDLNPDNLSCFGSEVDQDTISNLFAVARASNNASNADDWLDVHTFFLTFTSFTALDLTPFAKTNFVQFYVFGNDFSIVQGATESTEESEIEPYRFSVEKLDIDLTPVNDSMVAQMFKYIQPSSLLQIATADTLIEGTSDGGDFIDGLSAFTNLNQLILVGAQIQKLGGGSFRKNNKLTFMNFAMNHQLQVVGEDAFVFDGPVHQDMMNVTLVIAFRQNNLSDASFQQDNGLARLGRPFSLSIYENNFEFLSESNFEHLLMADERNDLTSWRNPFICDERMNWLKDRKEEFEHRVSCIDCTNLPTDIFGNEKCENVTNTLQ